MKKRILMLAAIFGASASFAQISSLKSKKGFEILPQAGDYAIQIDANPLLNFGLNAVTMGANVGTNANGGSFAGVGSINTTIRGKYFTSATEAYRVNFGINTSRAATTTNIASLVDPDDADLVVDSVTRTTQITIGGGMEWRRGHNRLQGFYGADINFMIGSPVPLTSVEVSADAETASTDYGYGPIVTQKGSSFGIMLQGFAGVEYFVLPKISIGGQVGWGLNFNSKGKITQTTVSYDAIADETNTDETEFTGTGNFGFATAYSGNIFATFHF